MSGPAGDESGGESDGASEPPHLTPEAAESSEPAAPVKLIRCPSCYYRFKSNKKFCPKCGRSREELANYIQEKRDIAADARAANQSWQRVLGMVLFYVLLLVLNFAAVYVLPVHESWGLLGADLIIVLICFYWMLTSRGALRGRFGLGTSLPLLSVQPLAAFVTFAIATLNNHLFIMLLGLSDFISRTRGMERFFESPIPLPVLIVSICVIPGIFEEIFFRGMVQGVLEGLLTKRDAWIVQAIVFAIAHVNPLGFFTYLLLLGLYLGWLRNRTGSLIPGMLAHFSHNLVCVLADHYHLVNW